MRRLRPILLEALVEVTLCALVTRLPERWYFRVLGLSPLRDGPDGLRAPESNAALRRAARVGQAAEAVGRRVFFHAVCLQRALAAHRMLRRRGIAGTVVFGVRRDAAAEEAGALSAHAWVMVGDLVVTGRLPDLDAYAVVGRYA